jgi:prepilin-type N-terminal cleavage/methylation domain-containing protein
MKKGFTLIELLVSLVVIGILGTMGYQGYTKITTKTKAAQLMSQLAIIQTGLAKYYTDMGTYPMNLSYLISRPKEGNTGYDAISKATGDNEDSELVDYWGGPYLDNIVVDPDKPECLKASVGGSICFGAKLADNSNFTDVGLNAEAITDGESVGKNPDSSNYYNLLSINNIPKNMAKDIYSNANSRSPSATGDLVDVAKGYTEDNDGNRVTIIRKIGLPSDANYAKSNRLVYKYTELY